jgi:hypothetical protein
VCLDKVTLNNNYVLHLIFFVRNSYFKLLLLFFNKRKNAFFKQKLDYTVFAKGKKEKDLQLLESKKKSSFASTIILKMRLVGS